MPKTFEHPVLGRLERRDWAWRGTTMFAGREISISLQNGRRRPDEAQVALLVEMVGRLPSCDAAARELARVEFDADHMELIAVHVFCPPAERLRTARSAGRSPLALLQYALPDDRNVVDVIFDDGEPSELDYH